MEKPAQQASHAFGSTAQIKEQGEDTEGVAQILLNAGNNFTLGEVMRIRRDASFISSVLLTIGLAALVPWYLSFLSTWRRQYLEFSDTVHVINFYLPMGFAGLALVLVGLIVIWTGYVQRVRWAWFVMFVIVWVYAFPVLFMLPMLSVHSHTELVLDAVKHTGFSRDFLKGPLEFLLLVVALFLPVRSFFRKGKEGTRRPGTT